MPAPKDKSAEGRADEIDQIKALQEIGCDWGLIASLIGRTVEEVFRSFHVFVQLHFASSQMSHVLTASFILV